MEGATKEVGAMDDGRHPPEPAKRPAARSLAAIVFGIPFSARVERWCRPCRSAVGAGGTLLQQSDWRTRGCEASKKERSWIEES